MRASAPWPELREWALRLWGTVRRRRADDDLRRELDAHLELAEDALRRQGYSPQEARRLARVRFGWADNALDSMRVQRSLPGLGAFALDVKLGVRMLRKHLGLTLIGGLTMAGAMTFGAALYHGWHVFSQSTLPLDEGDRVVVLQPWDPIARSWRGTSVLDFERWRRTLRSVEDVSAFRRVGGNLTPPNGAPIPVSAAQMTAAGFRVARVQPLLGRALVEQDEVPSAPPVVVIGYDAWQSQFAGDADVLGRTVELDGVAHTVVGVMPEGFRFPVSHEYWTNWTADAPGAVVAFGRLVRGATLENADAEIKAVGLEESTARGDAGEALEPRVVPYVTGLIGEPSFAILLLFPLLVPLVLLPPCANIAILIYARTLARQGEFAARAALGATRARIVVQVFVEMLVLALCAAAFASVFAPKLVDYVRVRAVLGGTPFWYDLGFSYATIGYAAALAVVAALIAGAIPALRATGGGRLASLHALATRSPPRLGRLWTAIVVVQVAFAAATVPLVAELAWAISGPAVNGARFVPADYLVARLAFDGASVDDARFSQVRAELARRLEGEPGVTSVTVAQSVPSGEQEVRIEIDGVGSESAATVGATFNRVDDEFFDAFGIRFLTGRDFDATDSPPGSSSIVVNQTFARRFLSDGNPLGRRIRPAPAADAAEPPPAAPWLEIVGVIEDFSAHGGRPTFYEPLTRAAYSVLPASEDGKETLSIAIHAASGLLPDLANRVRTVAATLEPDLRVDPIRTMDDGVYEAFWFEDTGVASALAGVMLGVLLLSAAGVYTLLAFAVVQRRREIGIRSALGARPLTLILTLFRRVLVPVGVAAGIGALGAALLDHYFSPALFELREGGRPLPWVLPAAEAFIVFTGLLVVAGPARRALRVDPVEALRDE